VIIPTGRHSAYGFESEYGVFCVAYRWMHGDGKSGIPSLFIGSETIMKTNLVQYLHMLCLDRRTAESVIAG
jgi:hypothetical protein